jgi:hypothetical protein
MSEFKRPRAQSLKTIILLVVLNATTVLAGCSPDKPIYSDEGSPDRRPYSVAHKSRPIGAPSTTASSAVSSDGTATTRGTPDYLTGDTSSKPEDSPNYSPLTDDAKIDPLNPKMPTIHSHWLRGGIYSAQVKISLNHVVIGTFTANIDKDITMSCRRGFNTIEFEYKPTSESGYANLDVLESEHDPPIPPLTSFLSSIQAPKYPGTDPLRTTDRTMTFEAQ